MKNTLHWNHRSPSHPFISVSASSVHFSPTSCPSTTPKKYFPPDIDLFIQKSTPFQLNNYLNKYEPVIRASIARNTSPPSPPPASPDIQRDYPTHNTPTAIPPSSTSNNSSLASHSSSLHPSQEEATHRKDRIRIPSYIDT